MDCVIRNREADEIGPHICKKRIGVVSYMMAIFVAVTCLFGSSTYALGERIGAEGCKACHADAYQKWQRGPHARSMQSLSGSFRKSVSCRSCHANASQSKVLNRPKAIVTAQENSVDCEACHGSGSLYAAEHIMKDRVLAEKLGLIRQTEALCLSCHLSSTPNTQPFDYEKGLMQIRHW